MRCSGLDARGRDIHQPSRRKQDYSDLLEAVRIRRPSGVVANGRWGAHRWRPA